LRRVSDPSVDRLVRLEGARNFRDLGGYRGADGLTVRYGCLFRSGELATLTDADRTVVAELGIATICDLRGAAEAERMPDVPIVGAEGVELAMGEGDADHGNMIDRVARGEIAGVSDEDMADIYVSLLGRFAPEIGSVLTLAADPDRHALLFHCAAGKDRTGLVAALLLAALGVSRDDILDDYELTNRYRSAWRIAQLRPELAARGVDVDVMTAYFSAPRSAMVHALATLEAGHGSLEGFLTGPGGVAPATLDALREHLLVP
jgi:protein-tyrosine phosphatase